MTPRLPLVRPVLLGALAVAGLWLAACQTAGTAPRGSAASAMSSGDRVASGEDGAAAAQRRLFGGQFRSQPAGR